MPMLEQKSTCFHVWAVLLKHRAHGKSLKNNNTDLCSMSFFLLKLLFGFHQSLSKWLWRQPWRLEGFPFAKLDLPERGSPFSCPMNSVYLKSTCISLTYSSTPVCRAKYWSRGSWVLLLTFTHTDWRFLCLWCNSEYRTKRCIDGLSLSH